MNKITQWPLVVILLLAFQVNAQENCSQEQESNNFENARFIEIGGQEFANDLIVNQNTTNFTLDSIQANIFSQGGIDAVDITFYEDNNGLPGTQIGSTIQNLTPSSSTNIGSAFGYDVEEITFVLPTPVDFSGTGTEDVHYWVKIVAMPNNPDGAPDYEGAALEITTAGTVGLPAVYNDDESNGYTQAMSGEDPVDGVISFYGTCTSVDCPSPENFTIDNLASASADLSWTEPGDATEWEIRYGPVGFDPDDTGQTIQVTDGQTSETLTGLDPETEYDVYIRTLCGSPDGNSIWTGPISFETSVEVDCNTGSLFDTICYTDEETTTVTYAATDLQETLNLTVSSGEVENDYDKFIVLDSNGDELYNGYGDNGDLSGLSFESTGPSISVKVQADTYVSCDSGDTEAIDLIVACATCTNPDVDFNVVGDCENGEQFLIDVDINDLGSATSLTVSDDQGNPNENATSTGILTFGPYQNGDEVVISVQNDDDQNCLVASGALTQEFCPAENSSCADAIPVDINYDNLCEKSTTGTLYGASLSDIDLNCGPSVDMVDVWFKFTASNETHMTALTDEVSDNNVPNYRTTIYSGDDCGNLTEIFCSVDFNLKSPNVVATDLTIGETYWVRVSGDPSNKQQFNLCITSPETPENTSCDEITPFCSPVSTEGEIKPLVFLNSHTYMDDVNYAEYGPDYGCLNLQPNPAWFYIKINEGGNLDFDITQNTAYDGNGDPMGRPIDVDFVAWGPFTQEELDNGLCEAQLTSENHVPLGVTGSYDGCGFSPYVTEQFGIDGAQADEIYVVLITNYTIIDYKSFPGYISLGQVNSEDDDAGNTDCTIVEQNQYLGCAGEELELTTHFPEQVAYIWFKYDPQTDEYVMIPDEQSSTLTVTEGGLYKLESYDVEGTIREEQFNVIFSPNPELDNLNAQESLCEVESVTLDGTVNNSDQFGGVTYQWSDENGEIAGATNPILEVSEPGIYTMAVTTTILDENSDDSGQECITTFEVEVTDADFSVSLGGDQTFCDLESYELTAELAGGDPNEAVFEWEGPEGPIDESTQSITVSESGTYIVMVDIGGCTGEASADLDFYYSPEFDLGDDIITCSLADLVLDATPSNFTVDETTFEWNYNGAPIAENGPIVNPVEYGYGTYTITAYADNPECDTEKTISIEENDDIAVNLTAGSELTKELNYCEQDGEIPTYELTLTANLENAPVDEVELTWFKNDTELPEVTGSTYTATYETEGDYSDDYTVEVHLGSCSAMSTVTANIGIAPYEHPCKVSEGLSPGNNDGINDCLDLSFINDRSGIAKLQVFNRYGHKVYEKKNYSNSWCGQDKNGDDLITGTYYYVLEMKNEDPVFGKLKRGWVYISRGE